MSKTLILALAGLAVATAGVWAAVQTAPGAAPAEPPPQVQAPVPAGPVLTLAVPSMTCGSCEGRITRALEARPGVQEVAVDLRAKLVRVRYDPAAADPKALADAVTAAGYPARYLPPGTPPPTPARSSGGCGGGCCDNRG